MVAWNRSHKSQTTFARSRSIRGYATNWPGPWKVIFPPLNDCKGRFSAARIKVKSTKDLPQHNQRQVIGASQPLHLMNCSVRIDLQYKWGDVRVVGLNLLLDTAYYSHYSHEQLICDSASDLLDDLAALQPCYRVYPSPSIYKQWPAASWVTSFHKLPYLEHE